jgi:multicomponent Na+:H+ antiporter subunit E
MFLLNILLALAWVSLNGEFNAENLGVGLVLGYAMLWLTHSRARSSDYFLRVMRTISFVIFYIWEVVLANLRVAAMVLSPTFKMRPGIIAIPLSIKTDAAITLLANLITLTPGTLSIDVSDDRKTLYVHTVNLNDPESFRKSIKEGFERRVQELME